MKNLALTFLLSLTTLTAFCQDSKKEIEKTFTEYLDATVKMDFRTAMDYIADEFFTIIPKEKMIEVMEQMLNNPALEIKFKDPKILAIKDVEKIDSKHYALLTYSAKMNMKFKMDEAQETEEDYQSRLEMTKSSLEQTFGEKNVTFDQSTQFFEIYTEKEVCAISPNGNTDWKFIALEKEQKPILQKILPKKIADRI